MRDLHAPPLLTFEPKPDAISVDLNRLVTSRMLIQANSGGGKSRALRYLLEQTHGKIQQLVLDAEGEFASLRERFPYVLLGREGDVPADARRAALLCRRLVELETSAIIDLYDLKLGERRRFVRLFLEELINLPRELWHPLMVVLDEAHIFCPERGSGEAESTEAVIALCTLGRKRGFMPVLATQRIAKLHKDAAAELLNVLIGRTGLDVDVRRAGEILGFDKQQRHALKYLDPGTFFAFGPAIAREVVQVRTGDVQTSHPEPGKVVASAPPPPEQLRQILTALRKLPVPSEPEVHDLDMAKRKITALEQQLHSRSTPPKIETVIERIEVPLLTAAQEQELQTLGSQLQIIQQQLEALQQPYQPLLRKLQEVVQANATGTSAKPQHPLPRTVEQLPEIPSTLDHILTIPAIAAKLKQAIAKVEPTAARYIPFVLRILWQATLTPHEIAEGRGTVSSRTMGRIQAASRALREVNLLVETGEGRLQVNQPEIERLRALAQALPVQQAPTRAPSK
ncbi:MAG TPA: DUF87 domain-containing protein [Sphingobacteriaceae bacterium]